MFQVGDLIRHSQLCTYGVITSLYKGWGDKYCDVLWFSTGIVTQAILTADCQKIS